MTDTAAGTGTGTEAETTTTAAEFAEAIIIIRDWQPGQVARIVFMTVEQAQNLPNIPPEALQIAVAPAGGL